MAEQLGGFSECIITESTIYPVLNGHYSTESDREVHLVAIMLKHESDDEWWNCMGADTYNCVMVLKVLHISQVVADRTYNWVMLPKGTPSIIAV